MTEHVFMPGHVIIYGPNDDFADMRPVERCVHPDPSRPKCLRFEDDDCHTAAAPTEQATQPAEPIMPFDGDLTVEEMTRYCDDAYRTGNEYRQRALAVQARVESLMAAREDDQDLIDSLESKREAALNLASEWDSRADKLVLGDPRVEVWRRAAGELRDVARGESR